MSGLFDLGVVWVLYLIGRRLYSVRVGLLAAALYTFAVLPLQQSHFYTVDTFGTFFAALAFYFCVRVAQGADPDRRSGWGAYVALGLSLGAALACRINLAPMVGIALLAAGIRAWDELSRAQSAGDKRLAAAWTSNMVQATLFRLVLMVALAAITFRMLQPYSFGGNSLRELLPVRGLPQQHADHQLHHQGRRGPAADAPMGEPHRRSSSRGPTW